MLIKTKHFWEPCDDDDDEYFHSARSTEIPGVGHLKEKCRFINLDSKDEYDEGSQHWYTWKIKK